MKNGTKVKVGCWLFIFFMTFCANAQNYQGLIRISPENPTEADEINVEFLTGCRSWTNHQFDVNEYQINYSVDYLGCLILPPPETFVPYSIGFLNTGNYTLELSIQVSGGSQVDSLSIPFSVGVTRNVPLSNFAYLALICLIPLLTFLIERRRRNKVENNK